MLVIHSASAGAQASRGPITTDRPDFTESSAVVGRGVVQLESGWTLSTARSPDGGRSHSWPELLARVGVSQRVELRAGQALSSTEPGGGAGFTALEDLYIGTKISLGSQVGARPELAIMLQATFPTGDDRLSADRTLPGGALLASWELGGSWSLATGLQVNRHEVTGIEIGPSVAAGFGISDRLGVYAEWFALQQTGGDGGVASPHYANAGASFRITPDVQVDGRIGFGLNDAADRSFIGIGLALRR